MRSGGQAHVEIGLVPGAGVNADRNESRDMVEGLKHPAPLHRLARLDLMGDRRNDRGASDQASCCAPANDVTARLRSVAARRPVAITSSPQVQMSVRR